MICPCPDRRAVVVAWPLLLRHEQARDIGHHGEHTQIESTASGALRHLALDLFDLPRHVLARGGETVLCIDHARHQQRCCQQRECRA